LKRVCKIAKREIKMFLSKDSFMEAGRTQNKKSKKGVGSDRGASKGMKGSFSKGTNDATKPGDAVKDMEGARSTNKAHKDSFCGDCE
jgi:hypothetical protein